MGPIMKISAFGRDILSVLLLKGFLLLLLWCVCFKSTEHHVGPPPVFKEIKHDSYS